MEGSYSKVWYETRQLSDRNVMSTLGTSLVPPRARLDKVTQSKNNNHDEGVC